MRIRTSGDGEIAYVTATDARDNLPTLFSEVLKEYPTIVVEKFGDPVAVIKRPEDMDIDKVETETF